jgi:transcriptional regulator with XRE-family HTH domain
MRTLTAPTTARAAPAHAQALRQLRQRQRLSQLELSLRVGVSQRHLSCIETGRAQPSRAMLQALLDALDAPLAERNQALLAAGYAPAFGHRALADAQMAPVRAALDHLLAAHDPSPAFVLDECWQLLQANRGTRAMLGLLGVPGAVLDGGGLNLLRALLAPGGLHTALVNAEAVCAEVWQRAQREAAGCPALRRIVDELRPQLPAVLAAPAHGALPAASTPLLETVLRTTDGGVLRFHSAFTTFGAPLDVTAASLRVEHFFAADAATARRLADAAAAAAA